MLARQSLHSGSILTLAFPVDCGFFRQCKKINSPRISDLQPLFRKTGVRGGQDCKSLAPLAALGLQPRRSTEAKSFRIRFYESFAAKPLRICIYVSHRGGGVPEGT